MAEAIGIASGIAGLISLTIEVFGISYKYINGVRDASSSAHRFLEEIENLQTVLRRVEHYDTQNDRIAVFGHTGSCLLSIEQSNEYIDLLQKVRDKLKQRQTSSSFRTRMKALTWPFSEKETLALTESLHRHLEIYNTALAVDSLTIGEITLSEVRQIGSSQEEARVKAVLDWLSPIDMYQKQQDTLSRRHALTGSWLLIDPIFQDWVGGDCSQPTLWCPGNPGTGKTVLTSVVIDHLLNNYIDEDTRIAYIYCDYKDQASQTASNLIACLARQIIGHPKAIPEQLASLHVELTKQNRRPSFDELQRLLLALCNQYARTYIVVDALDECEANRERKLLLPVLEDLPDTTTKIFVTSRRNNEDIFHCFSKASQITIAASEQDIRKYIMERIDERRDFANRLTSELKEDIISAISTGASGMFLLAALQIDRIFTTRTVKGIKSALKSMPDGLDELYRQALNRIQTQAGDDGALGMRILSWITHARRPLSVNELRHGLAVEYDRDEDETPAGLDEDNLLPPSSLVDVCAGLIIVESSSRVIRLVHFTTQEYLDKARLLLFKNAEVDISRACLTYLSYDIGTEFEDSDVLDQRLQSYPFLHYACHHWFSHVKTIVQAENSDPVLLEAVAQFKNSDRISISIDVLRNLDVGSRWSRKVRWEFDFAPVRESENFPLEVASAMGLEELVTVLLDHRTRSCPGLDTSLFLASTYNHLNVLKLLLEQGASVNPRFEYKNLFGGTVEINAIIPAFHWGDVSLVELLIENGADIHRENFGHLYDESPIQIATLRGQTRIIDLLLRKGIGINSKDSTGRTACHVAALFGAFDSLAYLIDAGCDLEAKTGEGLTPLHCAANSYRGEAPATVELLLDKGADINAKSADRCTALHIAAEYAYFESVKLLCDRGADVFAKDDKGLTPRDALEDRLRGRQSSLTDYEEKTIGLLRQLEEDSSASATVELITADVILLEARNIRE